jgi:hypothetical protein
MSQFKCLEQNIIPQIKLQKAMDSKLVKELEPEPEPISIFTEQNQSKYL